VTAIIVDREAGPAHSNLETVCRAADPLPPEGPHDRGIPVALPVKGIGTGISQAGGAAVRALIAREGS
jgi:hypothetical protein